MSDDRQEPPDDQTRPMPSAAAGDPDQTAPFGRTPEETAPLPPAQRSEPAWSGRAEVPAVRPGDDREPAGGDWYGDEPARPWWLPILWGVLLLLLLGVIGVGVWLARQAVEDDGPAPQPPQATTAAPPTTRSASPTPSSSPSPTASPTPVELPMPPLVGSSEAAARAVLDRLGLDHRVEYRRSDQPAGTVIATDPEEGELVEVGDEVTLVVAQTSPSPSPTTGPPTTEPTGTPSPTG